MCCVIRELEKERTQYSLKLAEEKAILRQMKSIERAKTKLEEYKEQERVVQTTKAEISTLRHSLRTTIAQIAELETALSKVELAKRLGCTTADLKTHHIDCPPEKLGHVIGKNGANIKNIEKSTGALVDVDKIGMKIHITGNHASITAAVDNVQKVTLAVNESIQLTPETIHYMSFQVHNKFFLLNVFASLFGLCVSIFLIVCFSRSSPYNFVSTKNFKASCLR